MKNQIKRFFACFIFIMAIILVGCTSKGNREIHLTTTDMNTGNDESVSSPNPDERTLEADELERCISEAILTENKAVFKPVENETYATESHKILKKTINEDSVTVYLVALYAQYQKDNDEVKLTGAVCAPVSISFIVRNGEYIADEYWIPEDGESYAQSINDKFPPDIVEDALALELPNGMESCDQNAEEYFMATL